MKPTKTCGQCVRFKKIHDIKNIASEQGQCCNVPPQLFPIATAGQLNMLSARPGVAESDPACSLFAPLPAITLTPQK